MTPPNEPRVLAGPMLLRPGGASLAAHRSTYGEPPTPSLPDLLAMLGGAGVRGRGGSGFPIGAKLSGVADQGGHPPVVVNFGEGEPTSMKDRVLATMHPHLVLDGAQLMGEVLRSRVIHVVAPGEQGHVVDSLRRALGEREGRFSWRLHRAAPRFVAGEGSAVVKLIDGRENLPVTTWRPTALDGLRGRPTLLSNAETFAQVAALAADPVGYAALGTPEEPGTRLLTVDGDREPWVMEVEHGAPWASVLPPESLERPVLLGGYHGTWAPAGVLWGRSVSVRDLADLGLTIGAGVVLPLAPDTCPLVHTANLVTYLAGQSARRCGPCL
ncbi:MAG: hypothetical protein ABI873_00570, partial [Marmoricola sp.]